MQNRRIVTLLLCLSIPCLAFDPSIFDGSEVEKAEGRVKQNEDNLDPEQTASGSEREQAMNEQQAEPGGEQGPHSEQQGELREEGTPQASGERSQDHEPEPGGESAPGEAGGEEQTAGREESGNKEEWGGLEELEVPGGGSARETADSEAIKESGGREESPGGESEEERTGAEVRGGELSGELDERDLAEAETGGPAGLEGKDATEESREGAGGTREAASEVFIPSESIRADHAVEFPWDI